MNKDGKDHRLCKSLHHVSLKRVGKEPWGFRIIGGKDQGKTFQVHLIYPKFLLIPFILYIFVLFIVLDF